jgi:hypothetical protein
MPVILASKEVEMRGSRFKTSPNKKVSKTLSQLCFLFNKIGEEGRTGSS